MTPTHTTTRTALGDAARRVPSPGCLEVLSARDLLAVAEHYDTTGRQDGLDAVHTEAERRAADHPADGLLAQLAGYVCLLAEDTEHALADEAHTWSGALRRALANRRDAERADEGPRLYRTELAVRVTPTEHDHDMLVAGWTLFVDGARVAETGEALSNRQARDWACGVLGEGVRFEPVLFDEYALDALARGQVIDWVANPTPNTAPAPRTLPAPRAHTDAAVPS